MIADDSSFAIRADHYHAPEVSALDERVAVTHGLDILWRDIVATNVTNVSGIPSQRSYDQQPGKL